VTAPTVREQLLRGGVSHIAEHGTDELTVRRLATASGRTTMCVYSKFGSRARYLSALYEEFAAQLLAALNPQSPQAYIESLRRWALDNPGGWDMLARTPVDAIELPVERRAALFAEVAQLLVTASGEGSRARAQLLLAGAYGLIALAQTAALGASGWDEAHLAASWNLLLEQAAAHDALA